MDGLPNLEAYFQWNTFSENTPQLSIIAYLPILSQQYHYLQSKHSHTWAHETIHIQNSKHPECTQHIPVD